MQGLNTEDKLPLLITNNSRCAGAFTGHCVCLFDENWNYGQVLEQARNKLHQGYVLLTHPQCGSMKPNQTPYKSLLLAKQSQDGLDNFASLSLIEQALAVYEKFQRNHATPNWPEKVRRDFRTIDLSLMEGVFSRL